MFTREELEALSDRKLRNLCRRYQMQNVNSTLSKNRIIYLMTFCQTAINQFRQGKGLKSPGLASIEALAKIIEQMNTPTDEQKGLVNFSLDDDRRLEGQDGIDQEKLIRLGTAHILLEKAYKLLSE
ncbi:MULTISPECIES: hypothetical protein [Calothrix]|uniref:Uncharacterized protein n=2 Tax=Calothrix TaxID=1186 RepID=A0ABR8AK38_9CYAN|nr:MULTISPECIES: hypothetical protein [Calothrix]MBD2200412.1 hypothetical protein [Calothrix parietina FACHB-288]MBD2229391.1 hypothetical protein [Calothrix anomala FACHB-343]